MAKEKLIEFPGVIFPAGEEREGVRGLTYRKCRFSGGRCNLRLVDCQDVTIEDCQFRGATGPADPDGHGLQLVRCRRVTIVRARVWRNARSEDGINVYQSAGVLLRDCNVAGHGKSVSGNAITIDDGSQDVLVTGGLLDVRGGARCLVVAGGSGHKIDGVDCRGETDKAIAVQACYKAGVSAVTINLRGLVGRGRVWIDPLAREVVVNDFSSGNAGPRPGKGEP